MKKQERKINWSNAQREIKQLKPASYNPRKFSQEASAQLRASIKRFNIVDPIVINLDNTVIGGHFRLRILKDEGITTVDVRVPDRLLSKAEEKELNLRLNKNLGDWDWDLLKDFDEDMLKDVGFDTKEIDELFKAVAEDDDDELPTAPEPRAKVGSLYQLGEHRVLCADSTQQSSLETLLAGKKASLLLTDPPYNVDYTGKTKKALKIQGDKNIDEKFLAFLKSAFLAADKVMRPGAVFYIWHADLEGYNFRTACHSVGWIVRQCLIWNKNVMVMGRQDYHWKHEPCLYGWKDGAAHVWTGDRKQTTVLDFDRPTRNAEHPTMKPVELLSYQITNSSERGGVVLDPFLGSGSTLIACEKNNRICYGIELDPKYVDVIIARWEKFTGEKAEDITNGKETTTKKPAKSKRKS